MKKVYVSFTLNGDPVSAEVPVTWSLVKTLREYFELTGTKQGCGVGECGACTVIVDHDAVNSCLYPIPEIDGKSVTTIEGMAGKDGSLHPLQKAFLENNGVQCAIIELMGRRPVAAVCLLWRQEISILEIPVVGKRQNRIFP